MADTAGSTLPAVGAEPTPGSGSDRGPTPSSLLQGFDLMWMDSVPAALLQLDPCGSVITANTRFSELTSWPLDQARGCPWWDRLVPAERDAAIAQWTGGLASGASWQWTGTWIDGSGRLKRLRFEFAVANNATGVIQRVVAAVVDFTPERDLAERLAVSEARWRTLVECAPEYVATVGRDLRLIYCNSTADGFQLGDLQGQSILNHVLPEDSAVVVSAYTTVFEHGQRVQFDARWFDPQGRPRWFSTSVAPLTRSGEIVEAISFSKNIDAQKVKEQSHQREALILATFRDAVLMTDPTGRVVHWSTGAERILGISATAAIGQSLVALFPERDRSDVNEMLLAALSGHDQRAVYRWDRSVGGTTWIELRLSAVSDQGRPIGVLVLAEDISTRLRSEAELRSNREFLQALLATLPGTVALWTVPVGECVFISSGCNALVGRSPEAFLRGGLPFALSLSHPDDRLKIKAHIAVEIERYEAAQGRLDPEPSEIEFRCSSGDGQWRWVHSVATVFDRTADGQICRVLTVSRDVTRRRAAEDQLREAHARLEQVVAERTAHLRNTNAELECEIDRRQLVEQELQASLERFDLMVQGSQVGLWDAEVDLPTLWAPQSPMYYSPRIKQLLGYRDDEFPGVFGTLAERFHPDDFPTIRAAVERHLFDHVPIEGIEFRAITKQGEVRWFSSHAQAVWDSAGVPVRMCGSLVDISARKQADERLAQEQDFLRTLLKAHERDRQLMAYDVHDGLMPTITAALYQLESILCHPLTSDAGTRDKVTAADHMLRQAITEGRRLLNGLRPLILDDEGIALALAYLAAEQSVAGQFEIDLHQQLATLRLDPLVEVTIYRIVQEALTNAKKYSQARRVLVSVHESAGRIDLSVVDQGVGFDITRVPGDRLGLRGMRRRAQLIGGETTIESAPGKGVKVAAWLPRVPREPQGP